MDILCSFTSDIEKPVPNFTASSVFHSCFKQFGKQTYISQLQIIDGTTVYIVLALRKCSDAL